MMNENKSLKDLEESNIDYELFDKLVKDDILKDQLYFAKQLEQEGESLLKEMELKRKKYNEKKISLISYIMKKNDEYSFDELIQYDYRDILDIYNDIKYQNRPWWVKLFEFLFG